MRNLVTLIVLLFANLCGVYANDCKVTYALDEGLVMYVIDSEFNTVDNGGYVAEGKNIMIALSCKNGYGLKSFTINGEDCTDKLGDSDGSGREFQYMYRVTGDIHIEALAELKKVPVISSVSGNGRLELYDSEGRAIESGELVTIGSSVTVKAVADPGNSIVEFKANDRDMLSDLKLGENQVTLTLSEKTIFTAVFTGEEKPDNECAVTWTVTGEGSLSVRCGNKVLQSGDKVVKDDYIEIKPMMAKGYSLTSLTVNGVEMVAEVKGKLSLQIKEPTDIAATFEVLPLWNELAADAFAGGDGTKQNPYQVETPQQLAKIANDVDMGTQTYSGVYFDIVADIDLAGYDWLPIGYKDTQMREFVFDGIINGNGHKIRNLNVNTGENIISSGLLGTTGEHFELHDLTIESGSVKGNSMVGAFVGYNRGLVDGCTNYAQVSCIIFYCGGIVGCNSKTDGMTSRIRNCVNYGSVVAGAGGINGISAGGIVGANSAVVEGCVNYGSVESPTSGAGGIAASMEGGVIRHCYNRGKVESAMMVGGICGAVTGREGDCEIYNSYSAASLMSYEANQSGGILGYLVFIEPNKFNMRNVYFDINLFGGPAIAVSNDVFASYTIDNAKGFTTSLMTSEDFVTRLNNETEGAELWALGAGNENDGYPVVDLNKYATGMVSPKAAGMAVGASGGTISVAGADAATVAEVYTVAGALVYSGTVGDMASHAFANGLYVVRVSGESYKVIVK